MLISWWCCCAGDKNSWCRTGNELLSMSLCCFIYGDWDCFDELVLLLSCCWTVVDKVLLLKCGWWASFAELLWFKDGWITTTGGFFFSFFGLHKICNPTPGLYAKSATIPTILYKISVQNNMVWQFLCFFGHSYKITWCKMLMWVFRCWGC